MRFREKREKESEKQRDEFFNQLKPMVPQGKEWRPKEDTQQKKAQPAREAASPVTVVAETIQIPAAPEHAVRPAVPGGQTALPAELTEQAVRPPAQPVGPAVTREVLVGGFF